jgi:hypothetical protein
LIEAAYKVSDLLFIERLFTQVIHSGPEDHSWISGQFGYRRVRTCRAKTPEQTLVSVWVWEREKSKAAIPRQSRSELEAMPSQVLSKFYQGLSKAEREELVYLVHGFSITARVDGSGLNQRTIEMRRSRLRDALGLNGERLNDEDRERLWMLGIRLEWGSLGDIGSLVSPPTVAQAVKRIAWFYDELPEALR